MVAVVTGATGGIGLVLSRLLVEEGIPVVLAGRNGAAGAAAAEELKQLGKAPASFAPLDLLEPDVAPVVAAIGALSAEEAPLALLINNAGLGGDLPWEEVDPAGRAALGSRILGTNYFGLLAVTEALRPLLGAGGTVLHVSSEAAFTNMREMSAAALARLHAAKSPEELSSLAEHFLLRYGDAALRAGARDPEAGFHLQAYHFSKACVNRLTELQAEAWPSLKVVCCCPGFTTTKMTAGAVPSGYVGPSALHGPEVGAGNVLAARAARSGCFYSRRRGECPALPAPVDPQAEEAPA